MKASKVIDTRPIVARNSTLLSMVKAHPKQVLRAFKIVRADMAPHTFRSGCDKPLKAVTEPKQWSGNIEARAVYCVGGTFVEPRANCNPNDDCGEGLNVGTYDWCMDVCTTSASTIRQTDLLMEVMFLREDVATFPRTYGRSGSYHTKFRVKRFTVTGCRMLTEKEWTRIEKRHSERARYVKATSKVAA